MLARELMSKSPEILDPETSLQRAAEIMRDKDIGFLPIGENDRLIGAVTDRDIVIRGVAEGLDPSTAVRKVMSEKIQYCFDTDSKQKVAEIMSNLQIRRLVVLNEKKRIVGIISLGDVATRAHDDKQTAKVTSAVSE